MREERLSMPEAEPRSIKPKGQPPLPLTLAGWLAELSAVGAEITVQPVAGERIRGVVSMAGPASDYIQISAARSLHVVPIHAICSIFQAERAHAVDEPFRKPASRR